MFRATKGFCINCEKIRAFAHSCIRAFKFSKKFVPLHSDKN